MQEYYCHLGPPYQRGRVKQQCITEDYWHSFMETRDLLRHQIIKGLMTQHPEKAAEAAINLWEQMAAQIISILGEDGFISLYTRSIFLSQARFPWLAASPV